MIRELDSFTPAPSGSLFATPRATSKAALESITSAMPYLRGKVLECLKAHPMGLTDSEIQTLIPMDGNTERARRGELVDTNLVENSGRTRRTGTSRAAIVWRAK